MPVMPTNFSADVRLAAIEPGKVTWRQIFIHRERLSDTKYELHTTGCFEVPHVVFSAMPSVQFDVQDQRVNPEDLEALVAGNVRAARARARMRQEDLADEIGFTRPAVTHLENGTRRLALVEAVAVCAALKITMGELFHGAPDEVLQTLGLSDAR